MVAFILVYLLFPVCGSKASTGSSAEKTICQSGNYCTTLRQGVITAEAGLCVVIPCSFTTDSTFKPTRIIWFKCETPQQNCVQSSDQIFNSSDLGQFKSGFEGRVSLLEPDVSQKNCGIIIKDLRKTDSGFYQLRVEGTISGQRTGFLFTRRSYLSVKGLTQKPTVMVPPLTEGQQTTLSCTAPGLCSGSAPEITWMLKGKRLNESPSTGNMKTENVSAIEQRHSSTLTFTPSAEHHHSDITCKVSFKNNISTEETETLNVNYVKDPVIRGQRTVKLGDALNLTCSVDSFPPSVVTWTKPGSNKTLKNDTTTVKLIILYMTAEDVGKYICSASHQITNRTTRSDVNVTMKPSILNSSACEVQSEVLTCVCISQGFPVPSITWPFLKNHAQHCVSTGMSKNTASSNISVSVRDHNYTNVTCVSRIEFEEVKEVLKVFIKNVIENEIKKKEDVNQNLIESISKPVVIVAFLTGLFLSAAICCSVQKCHRKKQKSSGSVSKENLEMMDVDAPASGRRHGHDRAEAAEEGEVEYSDINFDLLKRGRPIGAERSQETSEYAEIKKDKTERKQDDDGEDGEMMKGGEGEEVMVEERKDNVMEKEEKDDEEEEKEHLYSNVKDLMKEV